MKILSLALPLLLLGFFTGTSYGFVKTVKDVDLQLYLGTWYEIASTQPVFQKNCLCTQANYSPKTDGNIKVENYCIRGSLDGDVSNIEGVAKPAKRPGALKVSFGGPAFFANYLIADLAPDYSWVVVSGPFGSPLWILSRTPSLEADVLDSIYDRLERRWLKPSRLVSTVREGCPATNGSIAEELGRTGNFSILLEAVAAAGLGETLESLDAATILAPTNAAFEALGQETLEAVLGDVDVLRNILLYHVVVGVKANSQTVKTLDQIDMANGGVVAITLEGGRILVNDSKVVVANIQATNGVIHAIDKVLLP